MLATSPRVPPRLPPIVLFDGVCNLCDGAVQWIIDHDARGQFVFASLQSDEGKRVLAAHALTAGPPGGDPDTIVLVEDGRAYVRSGAALRIARGLGWPWKAFAVFLVVPPFLRDAGYRVVAHYRYAWFGKKAACRIPTPELKTRFLENRPELVPSV